MIGKGQLGPTQRETNATHPKTVLTEAEKQRTVSNRCKTLNWGLSITATLQLSCGLCPPGMVTGILSPVIYIWGDNPDAALLPLFAMGLWRTTVRLSAGGQGMARHSWRTATWEHKERVQMSPLWRGWDNLLVSVCRFTAWTASKKSHESRLRQMRFNVFWGYSASATSRF